MSALLEHVARRLGDEGIPFALIGAVAMATAGVSRSTDDLDLFTIVPRVLSREPWQELERVGVSVDIRRGDQDDPLLGVVRFVQGSEKVDLVVGKHTWQRPLLERARLLDVLGTNLPVVGPSDLILLKLFAGGYQDRWDIQQLLSSGDTSAISAEVEQRLADLPPACAELWSDLHRLR